MSKSKVNWAEVDKRIRNRRKDFSAEERKTIEAGLGKLPDLAEEAEIINIPQPATTVLEEADSNADGEGDAAEALN